MSEGDTTSENLVFRMATLAAMLAELQTHARHVTLTNDIFEFSIV